MTDERRPAVERRERRVVYRAEQLDAAANIVLGNCLANLIRTPPVGTGDEHARAARAEQCGRRREHLEPFARRDLADCEQVGLVRLNRGSRRGRGDRPGRGYDDPLPRDARGADDLVRRCLARRHDDFGSPGAVKLCPEAVDGLSGVQLRV